MMKVNKGNMILMGGLLLGLGFVYFSATFLVPRMLVTLTKAAPATKVSMSNSHLLGEKILCKADGLDKCVVNVFLSDSESRPVSEKAVSLMAEGVEVSPLIGKTDQMGKMAFFMTSNIERQVKVEAVVEGMSINKTVVVTFRGN